MLLHGIQPRYHVTLERSAEHTLPMGGTKFGGHPDVPPEWVWPTDVQGQPLRFVCQINFADLETQRTSDCLPHSGLLSVFWEFYSQTISFTYTQEFHRLERRSPPTWEGEELHTYGARRMLLSQGYELVALGAQLPPHDAAEFDRVYPACRAAVQGSNEAFEFHTLTLFGVSDSIPFGFHYADPTRPAHDPWLPIVTFRNPLLMDEDIASDTYGNHHYICEFLIGKQDLQAQRFSAAWFWLYTY